MDKVKKTQVKASFFALPVLIITIIFGLSLITCGAVKISDLNKQVGTLNEEEINDEISKLSVDLNDISTKALAEFDANGMSDEYLELSKQTDELSTKISELTNSRYMKETGYNNPNSLGKVLELAPTIWIGMAVIIAGIVACVVLKRF
ncbi:hypothetical protein J6X90_01955 [Candidatus Saccharibacteria bacterium]|nr:hypothetical protein [Candidatus Saccharibacteria bacterium]